MIRNEPPFVFNILGARWLPSENGIAGAVVSGSSCAHNGVQLAKQPTLYTKAACEANPTCLGSSLCKLACKPYHTMLSSYTGSCQCSNSACSKHAYYGQNISCISQLPQTFANSSSMSSPYCSNSSWRNYTEGIQPVNKDGTLNGPSSRKPPFASWPVLATALNTIGHLRVTLSPR